MAGNSESVRKSNKTMKEKYGPDFHSRNGAVGGRARKRGYFGRLKDEGKLDELRQLSKQGAETSNKVQSGKRSKRGQNTVRGHEAPVQPEAEGAFSGPGPRGVSER